MIGLVDLISTGAGSLVGFALGLLGGGGSILAVPLLIYAVGVRSPHVAIGTSAVAVAVNAFGNLAAHARAGNVEWPCASVFAAAGVAGAAAGAALGKAMDGGKLLFLFGLVMVAVAAAMLSPRASAGTARVRINAPIAARLGGVGAGVGALSGFFGIGGGFLIVPGLMLGSGMAGINAVASSLLSVGAFGLTTAISYALSGLVDWRVAAFFIAGGVLGGRTGVRLAGVLAARRGLLTRVFAIAVFAVAGFVLWRSAPGVFA
jgi:uncharacterized protein